MNMREELKAFVDNEISETQRTEILRALEHDADLQAEVIELRQISRVIREEAWQPEPVGLERTLAALAGNQKRAPWWLRPQLGWGLGAACAIVLCVFVAPKLVSQNAADSAVESATVSSQAGEAKTKSLDGLSGKGVEGSAPAAMPNDSKDYDLGKQERAYDRTPTTTEASPNFQPPATPTTVPPTRQTQTFQIKTANLAVEVADVPKAQQEAESIANAVGGRVQSSTKHADEGTLASAELTLRVPVSSFEASVRRVRNMGRVLNDSITGDDVTTQVVDARARLKVMRAEEAQYIELLRETKKIGEVLSVKEKLSQVRQEIESLDATRKALEDQAAESTINLSLTEKPSPEKPKRDDNWLESVWGTAVSGLSAAGRGLGAAVVYLFVYSPIWLPAVFIAWLLARRARR